jgi:hypothetical protein
MAIATIAVMTPGELLWPLACLAVGVGIPFLLLLVFFVRLGSEDTSSQDVGKAPDASPTTRDQD